jgi:hypothetical protein
MGVYPTGVHLMGVHLIDVYFMGVYALNLISKPRKVLEKPPDPLSYKRWSICRDLSFKIQVFALVAGGSLIARCRCSAGGAELVDYWRIPPRAVLS